MYIGRYLNDIGYFITDETAFGPYYPDFDDEHVALALEGWIYPIIPDGASINDLTDTFAFLVKTDYSYALVRTSVVNFEEDYLTDVHFRFSSLISDFPSSASCVQIYYPVLTDIIDFVESISTQSILLLLSESQLSLSDSSSLSFPFSLYTLLTLTDRVSIVLPVEAISTYSDFGDLPTLGILASVISQMNFSETLSTTFLYHVSDILRLWSSLMSTTTSYQTFSDLISLLDVFTFDISLSSPNPILFMVDIMDKKSQLFSVFDNPESIKQGSSLLTGSDGIYSYNLAESAASIPVVVLNPSSLLQSRIKRLDKIYSNVSVKKAIIYTDTVYSIQGNGKWVTIPRGVRSDTYEIAIYPDGDVEFIEVDIILERRAK